MRLLNAGTLTLEQFDNSNLPAFAILSHTWGADRDEVTFKHITDTSVRGDKPGFNKILQCCKLAQLHKVKYEWIGTCRIDKENGGGLTEAINSMCSWYQESVMCYVFLADRDRSQNDDKTVRGLEKCRWFTRGWTLQELLAPTRVEFYDLLDGAVNPIGTRHGLADQISKITGIQECYLDGTSDIEEASVAQRMSWVSKRTSSKPEDMTYCLLGLLNVTLPLHRGGAKAIFQRLQEKIIARSNDESIFAWMAEKHHEPRGMLASWPSEFQHSGHIRRNNFHRTRPPYGLTNRGLEFQNPARSVLGLGTRWMRESMSFGGMWKQEMRTHYLRLNCENERGQLIPIKLAPDPVSETFYRAHTSVLYSHEPECGLQHLAILYGGYEKIYIEQPRPTRRSDESASSDGTDGGTSLLRRSLATIFSFDNLIYCLLVHCFSCAVLTTSVLHRAVSLEPLYEFNFFLGWAYLNFGWTVLGQNFYFWVGALAIGLARPRPWSREMAVTLLMPGVVGGLMESLAMVRRRVRGRHGDGDKGEE